MTLYVSILDFDDSKAISRKPHPFTVGCTQMFFNSSASDDEKSMQIVVYDGTPTAFGKISKLSGVIKKCKDITTKEADMIFENTRDTIFVNFSKVDLSPEILLFYDVAIGLVSPENQEVATSFRLYLSANGIFAHKKPDGAKFTPVAYMNTQGQGVADPYQEKKDESKEDDEDDSEDDEEETKDDEPESEEDSQVKTTEVPVADKEAEATVEEGEVPEEREGETKSDDRKPAGKKSRKKTTDPDSTPLPKIPKIGKASTTKEVENFDILSAETEEEILKMISLAESATKYDGFDPNNVRKNFISYRKGKINETVRDLLVCFMAYSVCGNNTSRLTKKRQGMTISKTVMEFLNEIGIRKISSSKTGFTLPRIALAFMPEYLLYRKFIGKDFQDQTSSSLDLKYKDVVFNGCTTIREMAGYKSFHLEFSSFITSPGTEVALDDKTFLAKISRWDKIALAGYRSDVGIHNAMQAAITASALSAKQAFALIHKNIRTYSSV